MRMLNSVVYVLIFSLIVQAGIPQAVAQESLVGFSGGTKVDSDESKQANVIQNPGEAKALPKVLPDEIKELDLLVDAYIKATKDDVKKQELSGDAASGVSTGTALESELKLVEIGTFFQTRFFDQAMRKNGTEFPKIRYEMALKLIERKGSANQDEIAHLASYVQGVWQRNFYDVFRYTYMRDTQGRHERIASADMIVMAAFLGTMILPGPIHWYKNRIAQQQGFTFKAFKSIFPKAAESVAKSAGTSLRKTHEKQVAASIASQKWGGFLKHLGYEALKWASFGAIMTGGAALTYAPDEVIEIPVPPASYITLVNEPMELVLEKMDDEELVKRMGESFITTPLHFLTFTLVHQNLSKLASKASKYAAVNLKKRVPLKLRRIHHIAGTQEVSRFEIWKSLKSIGTRMPGWAAKAVLYLPLWIGTEVFVWLVMPQILHKVYDANLESAVNFTSVKKYESDLQRTILGVQGVKDGSNDSVLVKKLISVVQAAYKLGGFYSFHAATSGYKAEDDTRYAARAAVLNFLKERVMHAENGQLYEPMLKSYLQMWAENSDAAKIELEVRKRENMWFWERWMDASSVEGAQKYERKGLAAKLVLPQVPQPMLEESIMVKEAAEEVLGQYQAFVAEKGAGTDTTFAKFAEHAEKKASDEAFYELTRANIKSGTDNVIWQVTGFLRHQSTKLTNPHQRASVKFMLDELQSNLSLGANSPSLNQKLTGLF